MGEEKDRPKELQLDFESLGIEIDNEIDRLFSPEKMPEEPGEPRFGILLPEAEPMSGSPESGAGDDSTIDLESLQLEVEKEIDNLFAPQMRNGRDRSAVEAPLELPSIEMLNLETVSAEPDAPSLEAAAPVPVPEPEIPSPRPAAAAVEIEMDNPLPGLVEAFNAAYLTLDWEFSQENVRGLGWALAELEPFAQKAPGTLTVFKILRAIITRLSTKPHTANNEILELIRDSHSLLAHMLVLDAPPGAWENESIDALVARFKVLKERAAAAREAGMTPSAGRQWTNDAPPPPRVPEVAVEPTAPGPSEQAYEPRIAPMPEPVPDEPGSAEDAEIPDRWSLLELGDWMESTGRMLVLAVDGVEAEIERIRRLETVLEKTPRLAPLMQKLASIRKGLELRAASLREQTGGWVDRILWVENLARISASAAEKPADEASQAAPAPAAPLSTQPPPEAKRCDVYVFECCGKSFGIPAASLVKFQNISRNKARLILKRGEAVLGDVKPVFRSIRTGVLGNWARMDRGALKGMRFELVKPQVLELPEQAANPVMAVFLSDGTQSGILLTDSVKMRLLQNVVIETGAGSIPAALGSVRDESGGGPAQVLDPGKALAQRD